MRDRSVKGVLLQDNEMFILGLLKEQRQEEKDRCRLEVKPPYISPFIANKVVLYFSTDLNQLIVFPILY